MIKWLMLEQWFCNFYFHCSKPIRLHFFVLLFILMFCLMTLVGCLFSKNDTSDGPVRKVSSERPTFHLFIEWTSSIHPLLHSPPSLIGSAKQELQLGTNQKLIINTTRRRLPQLLPPLRSAACRSFPHLVWSTWQRILLLLSVPRLRSVAITVCFNSNKL